jgi:hypothetical protein
MQLDYHRGTHAKKEVSKRRSAQMAQTDVDEGAVEFIAAYDVLVNMDRNGKPDVWIPSHIFGRLDQDVKDIILEIKEELRGNGGQWRNNDRNFQQGDRGGRTPYDQGDGGGRHPYDNLARQGFEPTHNGQPVPKDSLEGTTTAIPKQYGANNARANMTHQNDDDDCDDYKRGVSDFGSDETGPDEDPGSDSPLVFEAMKVFKTVEDFGNQLGTPRKARMAHTVHFDAEDGSQADDEPSTSTNFAKDTRDVQWRDPSDRWACYLTTLGIHIST